MASETATAQNIKSQWGSLRIQKMQRMLERCARDLFVMCAEIIPAKFSKETLQDMTGIALIATPDMPQEKQAQIAAVNALLDKPMATYFRVDVESDSTVRADLTRQKQEASEFLTGSGQYFQGVMPLVQTGAMPKEIAIELYSANARMFNLGKSVEDTLEKWATEARQQAAQPQEEKPDPEQVAAQMEQQKAAVEAQRTATEAQTAQADNQVKVMTAQQQAQEAAYKLQKQQQDDAAVRAQKAAEFQQNLELALMTAQTADKAKLADIAIKEMDRAIRELDVQIKETDLAIKQTQLAKEQTPEEPEAETDPVTGEAVTKPDPLAVLTEAITAMAAAHAAPKVIVRDKNGKAVGVQSVLENG